MTSVPYRQLSRLGLELHASGIDLISGMFPGDYPAGILFILATRIGLSDWMDDDGTIRPPATPTRFTTANAMASSLGRPFETTRRHVNTLIENAVLTRHEGGLILSPTPDNVARVAAYLTRVHDTYIRHIEDACATATFDLPPPGPGPLGVRDVMTRALDVNLLPFDEQHLFSDNWTLLSVFNCMNLANVRHVTYDPVLARRYAVEGTPDELRRPVSLRSVAAALRMPYATAWRHCAAMEAAGMVTRCDDGWLVARGNLRSDEIEPIVLSLVGYGLRKLRELVVLGLDVDRVAERYIEGRPALLAV